MHIPLIRISFSSSLRYLPDPSWALHCKHKKPLQCFLRVAFSRLPVILVGFAFEPGNRRPYGRDRIIHAFPVEAGYASVKDLIDELFAETGKKINRRSNEILFEQDGDILTPYKLSSGEKQMLVILLTVLVQDNAHCALFMDEPEISLHIEWQQRLITLIRSLNPNVQIILTTHSPALIMNGWVDAVTEVSDITTN